ncbi:MULTISPECIES: TetR/AcrR family transcriptional regulator [unclassified Lactobacillus]|uniref:TetR/AcrR family transcriptional regulator n=1 Tax=unclassified Lactobacillus TaxID=2620435 RepID=UPI0023F6480D|nr:MULTISPECIES: TetR/AcrR family transcriptional regulator [unclassified Lactobacillus]MDF7669129.1 TetR/AcrR family transcriptional regulator [Lactobacillus sp. ESL0703]WEV38881.1 TetR/AcrR family transcriptional regulator [Lactobacillus sp. ESL0680]
MARKKEIGRDKILNIAYKMIIRDGVESLTARNIAKEGHFSTQPIYLEFSSMDELKEEVLDRIAENLQDNVLQKEYTGKPLIDMDLSYIDYAQKHQNLFRATFVEGKLGSKRISNMLIDLGVKKFNEQYQDTDYDEEKIVNIVVANWITTIGIASLLVNEIATFSQTQVINVLTAQINDAILNDWLSKSKKIPLFDVKDYKKQRKSINA